LVKNTTRKDARKDIRDAPLGNLAIEAMFLETNALNYSLGFFSLSKWLCYLRNGLSLGFREGCKI
jgi:hypothetical protein